MHPSLVFGYQCIDNLVIILSLRLNHLSKILILFLEKDRSVPSGKLQSTPNYSKSSNWSEKSQSVDFYDWFLCNYFPLRVSD